MRNLSLALVAFFLLLLIVAEFLILGADVASITLSFGLLGFTISGQVAKAYTQYAILIIGCPTSIYLLLRGAIEFFQDKKFFFESQKKIHEHNNIQNATSSQLEEFHAQSDYIDQKIKEYSYLIRRTKGFKTILLVASPFTVVFVFFVLHRLFLVEH